MLLGVWMYLARGINNGSSDTVGLIVFGKLKG